MNVQIQGNALKALDAKLAYIHGKGAQKTTQAIAKAIEEGNAYDRANGRDRYGRPVVPLKGPRKGQYAGKSGPPLAPSGTGSRVVTHFRAKARQRGGAWQVVAGWAGVVSRQGVPFLPFHDQGSGPLPRRPIFGVSPRTHAAIREIVKGFVVAAAKVRA